MIPTQATRSMVAIIAISFVAFTALAADDLPPGANLLDPDLMLYSWPYPIISPDGQWVTYVSKGFVCVCNVNQPVPRRLSEVPNTWTHVLAQPQYAYADGDWSTVTRALSREDYQKWVASVAHVVLGLQWTRESDAVVFAYQGYDPEAKQDVCEIRYAALDGAVTSLAKVPHTIGHSNFPADFHLTKDRKFLVIPGSPRPLIWDLATNKPRATPFLILTPSPASDRWLGVEKDTRQFVITDGNFEIVKRLDHEGPATTLLWSSDEGYIIWRNQIGIDYYSNWQGGWLDLKTGRRRELTGSYMDEVVTFTGRQGEFIRAGAEGKQGGASGLMPTAAYFQIVPTDTGEPKKLWDIQINPNDRSEQSRRIPDTRHIRFSPDFELFVVGLPRTGGLTGEIAHLMDRSGDLWRFPAGDNGKYIGPDAVVGFAEGGKSIIAHDTKRLFFLPVSTIKTAENKANLPGPQH